VGVRCKHGRLFLDFRWRGVRCREFTELTDTPENRRRCTALLRIIKGEIALGTFDYRRHFPNGTQLATFYPEVARSGTTVASFLSTWHARRSPFRPDGTVVEMAELHPSTWKHDGSLIERRLVPALGATRLTDLRIGRCRDYRQELEAEGLSGKTVTNILGLLHKAMADAVEEGLLRANPVPRLARRSRRAQGLRSNCDPLALDEVRAFLDAVPGVYRDLYVVWFRTGWRPSEILSVRFDWLDLHRQTVMLRLGRIARWGGVEAPPKTGPREVDCRYDPEIFAAFERRRRAALGTGHREYVFTDQTGKPLSQEWLHKRVWHPTLRRCGLHARGQYNIRDTFITNALSAGEDPGWVAQVCGTSEQMIFRHYRRWMPALSRTDGQRIAALFGPPTPRRPPRRGHQDGHQRGATTAKSLKSQRAESGRVRDQFEPPRRFACNFLSLRPALPLPMSVSPTTPFGGRGLGCRIRRSPGCSVSPTRQWPNRSAVVYS
jgi:integrase